MKVTSKVWKGVNLGALDHILLRINENRIDIISIIIYEYLYMYINICVQICFYLNIYIYTRICKSVYIYICKYHRKYMPLGSSTFNGYQKTAAKVSFKKTSGEFQENCNTHTHTHRPGNPHSQL